MVKRLIADKKGAYTESMKAQVDAEAQMKLLANERYRKLYKSVHNVDPGGEGDIFSYDAATRSLKR
jgi:peroxiredoxin